MTPAPWSIVYSETGRAGLATATVAERAAVLDFEKQLARSPHECGELYPDPVGGLYTGLLEVGGVPAWTSVLYRVDDEAREVLVVAIISGP
ncbi:type II toxin-antitoxin system RelE family toxin [Streptomyces tsukubensis]|uniref:type II toxin-antitoxin system RelE family toxin n=1 Tax=Streptomyces tsukubensis TaxID=83656 RepID=UPI003450D382